MVLEFLPQASDEVAEAASYYDAREKGLGVRFRLEVESACNPIVLDPLLWRERHGICRRANLPGYPYYIAYFIRGERVLIAAVAHVSRHPDHWKKRAL